MPENALRMTMAVEEETVVPFVIVATELVISLASVLKEMVDGMTDGAEDGNVIAIEITEADPNATNVTGSVILHENVAKKRIDATNVTGPVILPETVIKRKTLAITATRWGT